MIIIRALAALSVFLALPVAAQSPLLDKDRLAFGLGASYDWHEGNPTPVPPQKDEACANLFGAYALTEHVSAVARATYGAGNRVLRVSPGVHYNVRFGGESVALGLTYDFYAGDYEPVAANEWVVSLIYAKPFGRRLTVAGVASRLFDNNENRFSVQATVPLWVGADD
jgi:hypothetical protein